jgi:hypothetical protein
VRERKRWREKSDASALSNVLTSGSPVATLNLALFIFSVYNNTLFLSILHTP